MYALFTTTALILRSYPHGESNRTYKILSREKGLLYVHGQGVRELKSKNKFALQSGQVSEVTLVRGREVWKITGARNILPAEEQLLGYVYWTKLLGFIGEVLPLEEPVFDLYNILCEARMAFSQFSYEDMPTIELMVMVRLMDNLGFVSRIKGGDAIDTLLETPAVTREHITLAKSMMPLLREVVRNARTVAN